MGKKSRAPCGATVRAGPRRRGCVPGAPGAPCLRGRWRRLTRWNCAWSPRGRRSALQAAALLRVTLHVSVRCRLHPRRMASSRTPTRGSSFARCPSYQAQVTPAPTASTAPSPPHTPRTASSTSPPHLARLRPLQAAPKEDGKLSYAHTRFEFCEMPELSSTGHPVARDQLDQAGQDRRDQLLLLASRPVVLPHTRLGSGSHMHSIFIRQVQALLYLLLALY